MATGPHFHPRESAHKTSSNGCRAELTPQHGTHPALDALPAPVCVSTATPAGRQPGLALDLVQLAALEPPTVFVSLPKGHSISPMIRDSRVFGLCQLAADDRLLLRRFRDADDHAETNPFDGLETERLSTGVPLLTGAMSLLDCEVAMHLDIEADYEVYMARVVASRNGTGEEPMLASRSKG